MCREGIAYMGNNGKDMETAIILVSFQGSNGVIWG